MRDENETEYKEKKREKEFSQQREEKRGGWGKIKNEDFQNESATRQGLSLPKLQHLGLRGGFGVVFGFSLSTTCSIQVGCSH